MKTTILFTSLTLTLAWGMVHAPALRADESDYSPTRYDADEAKEMRSFLRPFLDPSYIPSPEYLNSWPKARAEGEYQATETPDQMKAHNAKLQVAYNAVVAALPEKLSAPVTRKRKILVLTYRTHTYFGSAGAIILLREAAKKYGAFEVTEVYKPDGIDEKMLAGFDAVVLNGITIPFRNGPYGRPSKDYPELMDVVKQMQAENDKSQPHLYNELLPNYVKGGGGLVAIHGAFLLAGFVNGWEEKADDPKNVFSEMLGGAAGSWPHPHGKVLYYPFEMQIMEPENPLTLAFREAMASNIKIGSEA